MLGWKMAAVRYWPCIAEKCEALGLVLRWLEGELERAVVGE